MKKLFLLLFLSKSISLIAQDTIPLYPKKIPNSKIHSVKEIVKVNDKGWVDYEKISIPNLVLHKPANPNGTVMIVVPGGGYKHLAYTKEGELVAKALNEYGITALVLKYRHPLDSTMVDKSIGPIQDLQQAILYVRSNAKKLKINPSKLGVIGFSAGGHLASTSLTHYRTNYLNKKTKYSLRPDFGALIYPVISMEKEITHAGSRNFLLGENPSDSLVKAFSNDLRVDSNTPNIFIMHAEDDKTVKIENSLRFINAMDKYGIYVDFFRYKLGGHGFSLENSMESEKWFPRFILFLRTINMLPAKDNG